MFETIWITKSDTLSLTDILDHIKIQVNKLHLF